MSKKAAFIIAGFITTGVMVLVLGLGGAAAWFNQTASAAAVENTPAAIESTASANPEDVAILQAQLNDYQVALEQANTQLQAAYDEIANMQAQGGFSGEHEEYEDEHEEHEEHEDEHEGGFFGEFEDD